MKEILKALLVSLNKIEVRGKENHDILLSCINAVELLIDVLYGKEGEKNADHRDEPGDDAQRGMDA